MSELWFTADLHMDHTAVIKYCNRPFDNVDQMNDALLTNLNERVKASDTLFFLGDFCMAWGKARPEYWLERINCKNIFFVFGNHDLPIRKNTALQNKYFVKAGDVYECKHVSPRIWMSHYSHRVWPKMHYKSPHLYAHSHGNLPDDPNSLSFDVGVDCWNYCPINYEQVLEKLKTKTFIPIDHHEENND